MTLEGILESLARDTWERLRDSIGLDIRFGEETITDLLLLDLKRQGPGGSRVIQTPKHNEKHTGTDWEWWIGTPRIGWLRFAVQAKKMNLKNYRYDSLSHKVGGTLQIDLLERYATSNDAIPIYCLYNYIPTVRKSKSWQCCKQFEVEQLACTITPSHVVKKAINTRGTRNFHSLHSNKQTLPWRCLADCPKRRKHSYLPQISKDTLKEFIPWDDLDSELRIYESLPKEINLGRETGRIESFPVDFYSQEVSLYPRRVLVFELDSLTKEA